MDGRREQNHRGTREKGRTTVRCSWRLSDLSSNGQKGTESTHLWIEALEEA